MHRRGYPVAVIDWPKEEILETTTDEVPTLPATIAVTEKAAVKIAEFLERELKASCLRIAV